MLDDFFTQLVGAFARLVTAGFLIWMAFVVLLFFKELFTPGDVRVKEYLYRVWRMLLFSFEITAYGGVLVALFFLIKGGEEEGWGLLYGLMLTMAILASWLFIRLRIRTVSLRRKKNDSRDY
ncbi:hypothetical protein [Salinithrix halophila]|uniref:YtpI-like protein n=1 Tax=Salinithrix halophila TaxID=1485204 RepID=A0ABV8JEV1_9BACL